MTGVQTCALPIFIAGASSCGDDVEGPTAQKLTFKVGAENYSCGDQAQRARERIADELAKEAEGCEREIQSACGSYSGPGKDQADKAKKACKDLKDKSNQAGNERKGEAGDMKKNADKSGDNGKGLGSMPQIPQMPQQGGGDDKPQENPPPQQENKTELAESKPPETQVSKIGADTKKSDQVGFGGSTDTRTSTVSPPPGGFGGNGLPLSLASLPNASLHDSHSGSGRDGTGSSSPGGGGGANLAGQGGASPSGTDSKTEPNSSNPYEIGGAAGGKLGAPKGFKSGSDPDSAVADAAKDNFKSDIGDTASKNASEQAAEEAIEDGYTVFRMVKLRYLELKKKGSI